MPKRTVSDAARDVCLWLPNTEAFTSHGSPAFRFVAGRQFAVYSVNHHGDGIVALHLAMPSGSQRYYVESEPDRCFVPPYVGPKGWLGIHLSVDTDWQWVAARVRDAACHVCGQDDLPAPPAIKRPSAPVPMMEFDPLQTPAGAKHLKRVRKLCLALPEASEGTQWGQPKWLAGKKTFCTINASSTNAPAGRFALQTWCGKDLQTTLTADPRFRIPPYTGHNGWIELAMDDRVTDAEISRLIETSYRRVALKRMLKTLDG